jgi:hypothetical protein
MNGKRDFASQSNVWLSNGFVVEHRNSKARAGHFPGIPHESSLERNHECNPDLPLDLKN